MELFRARSCLRPAQTVCLCTGSEYSILKYGVSEARGHDPATSNIQEPVLPASCQTQGGSGRKTQLAWQPAISGGGCECSGSTLVSCLLFLSLLEVSPVWPVAVYAAAHNPNSDDGFRGLRRQCEVQLAFFPRNLPGNSILSPCRRAKARIRTASSSAGPPRPRVIPTAHIRSPAYSMSCFGIAGLMRRLR